jgi:hypothetical protein
VIGLAALVCGLSFSVVMNYHLELGQSWQEQVKCGLIWAGGFAAMFIVGTQML